MTIHINSELEKQLKKVARKTDLSPDAFVSGILESFLDAKFGSWENLSDLGTVKKIKQGLDDLDNGKSSNFDESTIEKIHLQGLKTLSSRKDV